MLELQHILYDLIPSYYGGIIFEDYKIPNSKNAWTEWKNANIGEIKKFNKKCKNYKYFIDVVRLLKLFNFNNGYYYNSFEIEEALMEVDFDDCENLDDYFFYAVENIHLEATPTLNKLRSFKDKLLSINEIEKNREKIKDIIEKFMVQL